MNRREQNRALKKWEELKDAVGQLDAVLPTILLRGTHSSGQRRHVKLAKSDPMYGTPPPFWGDETGELAITDEIVDDVEKRIIRLLKFLHYSLDIATGIIAITPQDVTERAEREVPNCLACGDPCVGGVRSGFDDKCRKRWDREGRPERGGFIARVKSEVEAKKKP